jgi:hypothetical protein
VKIRVFTSSQVRQYLAARAPETRKVLKTALRDPAHWDGLEDPPRLLRLEGAGGLLRAARGAGHRVIFREATEAGERRIFCLHAGPRATVYEWPAELLLDELAATDSALPAPPAPGDE